MINWTKNIKRHHKMTKTQVTESGKIFEIQIIQKGLTECIYCTPIYIYINMYKHTHIYTKTHICFKLIF